MGELDDIAEGVTLVAIDKVIYLREQMEAAVRLIVEDQPQKARWVLDEALEATDFGKMKVWQPHEQPF
jgi:hypothetical protein